MDDLHCNACGADFDAADSDWDFDKDDPTAQCPECGSDDISTGD
ncbi:MULTISPECIES: hypothetical protein [unclassified Comamonas]|nr:MULTISPECIES: hypothetical protein [unclassified Comamonas]